MDFKTVFSPFLACFFTFRVFCAPDANGEDACHGQEQLKPCGCSRSCSIQLLEGLLLMGPTPSSFYLDKTKAQIYRCPDEHGDSFVK